MSDIAYETFKSILDSISEIVLKLESHFRNKQLVQITQSKGLELKWKEQEELIKKYESELNKSVIQSSIDATKEIDWKIGDFLSEGTLIARKDYKGMKPSEVDSDLENLYDFLSFLMSSNSLDHKVLMENFQDFDKFQDLIKNQGKSLQMLTSKVITKRVLADPPLQVAQSVQTDKVVEDYQHFLDEIEKLEMEVTNQNNIIQRLLERSKQLEKTRENLKNENVEYQVSLNEAQENLKKTESRVNNQRSEVKMLDDLTKKVKL